MNKRLLMRITLLLIAAGVAGYYFFPNTVQQPGGTSATSSATASDQPPELASTTEPIPPAIHVPVTILDSLQTYYDITSLPFTDPESNITVTLRESPLQARNPGANLYIGATLVGDVEGMGITASAFSPNGRAFSFIETNICGAVCEGFDVYLLNINQQKLVMLPPTPTESSEAKRLNDESPRGYEAYTYISSIAWAPDSSALDVTSYVVDYESSPNGYYRISPIRVWRYDLATQTYTLVQTLPEE